MLPLPLHRNRYLHKQKKKVLHLELQLYKGQNQTQKLNRTIYYNQQDQTSITIYNLQVRVHDMHGSA